MLVQRPVGYGVQRVLSFLPNPLLILLSFYALMHILHLVYFIVMVQPREVPVSIERSYMLCISAGTAAYFWGSSAFLYLPYRHGSEMSPIARFDYMSLGVALNFLLHELPLGWLQIWLVLEFGLQNEFQGIVFLLSMISFAVSLSISWTAYAWKMSELLQRSFSVQELKALHAAAEKADSGGGGGRLLRDWLGDGKTHKIRDRTDALNRI